MVPSRNASDQTRAVQCDRTISMVGPSTWTCSSSSSSGPSCLERPLEPSFTLPLPRILVCTQHKKDRGVTRRTERNNTTQDHKKDNRRTKTIPIYASSIETCKLTSAGSLPHCLTASPDLGACVLLHALLRVPSRPDDDANEIVGGVVLVGDVHFPARLGADIVGWRLCEQDKSWMM